MVRFGTSRIDVSGRPGFSRPSFRPLGVHLDGSSAISITGQPTGVADSKVGTFAARFRTEVVDTTASLLDVAGETASITFRIEPLNRIHIAGFNAALTSILQQRSANGSISANVWYNVLISYDLLNDTRAQVFLNDVDDGTAANAFTDDTIDYTKNDWNIGQKFNEGNRLTGDLHFVWFDESRAIDFSVEANRRDFFDADGNVTLNMSGDGTVGGSQPLLFFRGRHRKWHINQGSAGGTWDITGTLTQPDK